MGELQSSSSRLAKNTLVLYFRTMIVMIIGLYTSRVLLAALGIDNFGIYNVIGGFVGMFSIITGTLVATTQRYLNVEIGKGENGDTKKIFGVIFGIHFLLAILMLLIFETIGLWFLNNKLNIPADRLYAANWVYQLSVFSAVLSLFSTPYIGVIVANERMKAFAYISLQDAILKLGICYLLYIIPYDRLIVYATLFWIILVWNQCIYVMYCLKNFKDARISIVTEKSLYKSMFGFAGMNFIGSFSYILSTQGVNIVLNMFFGVAVNAARAIAIQIQSAIGRFVNDFMTALNPQITKEYAADNREVSCLLAFRGAKFGFYITLILTIPIYLYCTEILHIWLDKYPEYTVVFVKFTLISFLVSVLAQPFVTLLLATGDLTKTTWWIGGTRLLVLPLIYMCFKIWNNPIWAYVVVLAMDSILVIIRLHILSIITKINLLGILFKKIIPKLAVVTLLSIVTSCVVKLFMGDALFYLILFSILSVISSGFIILLLGLEKNEKSFIITSIKNKFSRLA